MKIFTKLSILLFMSFFSSLFGQTEEHIYLAGWEVEFNGDEQCQKFLKTQVVDKKTANNVWASIDLVFKNGKLVKAYDNEEGKRTVRELNEKEIGLEFQTLKPNQIFRFVEVDTSKSYLGGDIPDEFKMPDLELKAPFQYLGKLSNTEEAFNWLPSDIHLIAPLYLDIDKVFVDYSDPLHPKILNKEELEDTESSYDEIKPNSELIYEKVFITMEKTFDFDNMAFSGVPNWIQNPEIPTCPKSKKTMKFLCQLTDALNVKTKTTSISPKDDWSKLYYERMNFWGDGDLYIFFEPESKVACFFIQHT
ncbi:MAG: hypothetical protein Wins2KO_12050 [Winogradskyella sp.]